MNYLAFMLALLLGYTLIYYGVGHFLPTLIAVPSF
jgi:hypothetical protein